MGRKGLFVTYQSQSFEQSQSRSLSRAETWRQELEPRPWRNTAYGLASLLSYIPQDHLPRDGSTLDSCTILHQSSIIICPTGQTVGGIYLLSCGSRSSDVSNCYQVDQKQNNQKVQQMTFLYYSVLNRHFCYLLLSWTFKISYVWWGLPSESLRIFCVVEMPQNDPVQRRFDSFLHLPHSPTFLPGSPLCSFLLPFPLLPLQTRVFFFLKFYLVFIHAF